MQLDCFISKQLVAVFEVRILIANIIQFAIATKLKENPVQFTSISCELLRLHRNITKPIENKNIAIGLTKQFQCIHVCGVAAAAAVGSSKSAASN